MSLLYSTFPTLSFVKDKKTLFLGPMVDVASESASSCSPELWANN